MPGRRDVLKALVDSFHTQNYDSLVNALSTHIYETDYNGHNVVFGKDLTAAGLCKARMEQDPEAPAELSSYHAILEQNCHAVKTATHPSP